MPLPAPPAIPVGQSSSHSPLSAFPWLCRRIGSRRGAERGINHFHRQRNALAHQGVSSACSACCHYSWFQSGRQGPYVFSIRVHLAAVWCPRPRNPGTTPPGSKQAALAPPFDCSSLTRPRLRQLSCRTFCLFAPAPLSRAALPLAAPLPLLPDSGLPRAVLAGWARQRAGRPRECLK